MQAAWETAVVALRGRQLKAAASDTSRRRSEMLLLELQPPASRCKLCLIRLLDKARFVTYTNSFPLSTCMCEFCNRSSLCVAVSFVHIFIFHITTYKPTWRGGTNLLRRKCNTRLREIIQYNSRELLLNDYNMEKHT